MASWGQDGAGTRFSCTLAQCLEFYYIHIYTLISWRRRFVFQHSFLAAVSGLSKH